MHEDAFELLACDAKVLEIDDHLSDLRQIAHRPELLGDLLADIVRKKVIQGLSRRSARASCRPHMINC